ncbi:MAG: hypothetical protein ABIK52_08785 [Bacteroidota bacterium]
MKTLSFFSLMLLVILSACKKSEPDDNNPIPDGKICKLIALTATKNGVQYNGLYYYNNSGNFLYSKSFRVGGDTTIGYQYEYLGDVLGIVKIV